MLVASTLVGSAIIKNGIGIGAGIFLLPFLSLILPPKIALGIGAPSMWVSDIVGVRNYWKEWDNNELKVLVPFALIGVIFGGLIVKMTPNDVFKFWVGVFAVVSSTYNIFSKKLPSFQNQLTRSSWKNLTDDEKITALFGFLGGVASTVIHAGGMVMSVYLLHRNLDKRTFVGTFVVFFAIVNFLKSLTYIAIGILTTEIVLILITISPLIILGGLTGNLLNKKIPQELFRLIVLSIIFIIGARLIFSSIYY
jgi:hypothetical protein